MKNATLLLLISIYITSCFMRRPLPSAATVSFDKQGHRGSRGLMPENTIPAMIKAIDLNVTTLEMDAVITKDGKVVLSHEPFFNHDITTKPDGSAVTQAEERQLNIYQFMYDEVKRFDVGMKPHPRFARQQKVAAVKPLLSDVIDSVEQYSRMNKKQPLYYNIETKSSPETDNAFHPSPEPFVDALMKVIESKNISDRVIIQSFDFRTLKVVHAKYPKMKTAALIENFDKRSLQEHLDALGFTPTIYSPEQSLVTMEMIKACHDKKMKIIPWTVNVKAKIEEFKKMGVDGIITDYPDLF